MAVIDNIADVVTRRSEPGILVFNSNADLLFCNTEASKIVETYPALDKEIRTLCRHVKSSKAAPRGKGIRLTTPGKPGDSYVSARAFTVGEVGREVLRHIVVLLEKITERHKIDLQGRSRQFGLSKRELEVVVLVREGRSNKIIAEQLFISPQTVKDHIRHMMRKVGVNSRTALIAALTTQ